MNDILVHHGIKGQRWGIRRYQKRDGTLTAAGKKRYSGQVKFKDAYELLENKKINSAEYKLYDYIDSDNNVMRTNEILLPKDLELNRISTHSDEQKSKALYVNFVNDYKQLDYYKKSWPYEVDSITGKTNDWYSNTFKLSADIKAPSLERRKQAANAIINADEKMKIELGKKYVLRQLQQGNMYVDDYIPAPYANSFAGIKKYYKDFKSKAPKSALTADWQQEIKEDIDNAIKDYEKRKKDKFDAIANPNDFQAFTQAIPRSKKLMNAYIAELKKDGFDAVFDDNAGAKAAFIVFDAKSMNQVNTEKLDINYDHFSLNDNDIDMYPWIKKKLESAT